MIDPDKFEPVTLFISFGSEPILGSRNVRMWDTVPSIPDDLNPKEYVLKSVADEKIAELVQSRHEAFEAAIEACEQRADVAGEFDDMMCCKGAAKNCASDIEALKNAEEG